MADQAHLNKMPIENIARVVAPSVLIPQQKDSLNAAGRESRAHEQVMIELLKMKPVGIQKFHFDKFIIPCLDMSRTREQRN